MNLYKNFNLYLNEAKLIFDYKIDVKILTGFQNNLKKWILFTRLVVNVMTEIVSPYVRGYKSIKILYFGRNLESKIGDSFIDWCG